MSSWEFHHTTVDIIRRHQEVLANNTADHRLGSAQNVFHGSREFSKNLVRGALGSVDNTISSKATFLLSLLFFFFCLLVIPGGFDAQPVPRRKHLNLVQSFLKGLSHWNPQNFSPATLMMSSPKVFRDRPRRPNLGGQGRRGSDFTNSASQVYDFYFVWDKLRRQTLKWQMLSESQHRTKESYTLLPLRQKLKVPKMYF